MRVIAGSWKGRRLKSPSGEAVRPTTDRVKEALFNILGPDVEGSCFLDLCCGAGGLGIEALSRGADSVVFVDLSRKSLAVVRDNLELCGAESRQYQLVCAEAVAWLGRWNPPAKPTPWILVADPPYHGPVAGAIMEGLERLAPAPGFRAGIIEYGSRTGDLPPAASGGLDWTVRRYGESHLAVARAAGGLPEGE
ncbi:MAG: 16S rRNA (guanine(966)-N(2))-methyltransferase RsmD [Candidatus Krumholzibacteriota bacterium]